MEDIANLTGKCQLDHIFHTKKTAKNPNVIQCVCLNGKLMWGELPNKKAQLFSICRCCQKICCHS